MPIFRGSLAASNVPSDRRLTACTAEIEKFFGNTNTSCFLVARSACLALE